MNQETQSQEYNVHSPKALWMQEAIAASAEADRELQERQEFRKIVSKVFPAWHEGNTSPSFTMVIIDEIESNPTIREIAFHHYRAETPQAFIEYYLSRVRAECYNYLLYNLARLALVRTDWHAVYMHIKYLLEKTRVPAIR